MCTETENSPHKDTNFLFAALYKIHRKVIT